jgi:hypothetical protein
MLFAWHVTLQASGPQGAAGGIISASNINKDGTVAAVDNASGQGAAATVKVCGC